MVNQLPTNNNKLVYNNDKILLLFGAKLSIFPILYNKHLEYL